ncbi:hypothetical protein HII36_08260 [Nonomuraea sp. NN258]|uniref:hypothetical protein n=1 Tax=Nonomuraea antri TaxID=2730852 RepID=UPI0015696E77|nr:hypothetical protein [Nonomuraea antri]NRQ31832.1 hypothetical protein [Nonomuraea antri]
MATTLKTRDWRYTELVMKTWTETAQTSAGHGGHVLIEDLDHPAPVCAPWSYCG